ncbi:MAG: ester cyclase [Candidatus Eisenbacteria bacterium]
MSGAHEETMRRFVDDVLNGKNPGSLHDLVDPDYVYRAPGEELRGRDGLAALLEGYRSAFPDLEISIDELVSGGDVTVLSFTLTGTHRGDLLGHAPTGHRVKVHGMVRSRFRNGRIVDEWELIDQLSLFQQLGLT